MTNRRRCIQCGEGWCDTTADDVCSSCRVPAGGSGVMGPVVTPEDDPLSDYARFEAYNTFQVNKTSEEIRARLDDRSAFYAGWDAALRAATGRQQK